MDIKRFTDISPMSIFIGILSSQIAGAVLAYGLIAYLGVMYRYEMISMFFENPIVIFITQVLSLLSVMIGGYCSMLFSKKALINPLLVGLFNLLISYWFMHILNFEYGGNYLWMIVISLVLIIPSSVYGGYFYQRRNASQAQF